MGWSWVRVSTGTSPKLRDCTDGDPSASRFEDCVGTIVAAAGGDTDSGNLIVKFEPNGRWARVGFKWDDVDVKYAVVYDLEGREVLDLLSAGELDGIRTREPPTAT
ncbi:MAG TPA: hypothetical protein VFO81_12220 [Gaiellaceae bacterium]|nr:hypothetical protein [Gaiellaceae bacterium]